MFVFVGKSLTKQRQLSTYITLAPSSGQEEIHSDEALL